MISYRNMIDGGLILVPEFTIKKQPYPGRGEGVFLYERREGGPGVPVSVETGISAGETGIPEKAKYPIAS